MSQTKSSPNQSPQYQEKTKKPKLYKVILFNDDYTPMDFVVEVLMKFFQKTEMEAQKIMLEVHHKGSSIAGVYTRDIAETKAHLVNQYAKSHEYPLKTAAEPE